MKKTWYVIKREYLESVRKKSFIISTILAPIIMLVIYGIPVLAILFVSGGQVSVTVLDRSGVVGPELAQAMADTLKDGQPKYLLTIVGQRDGDLDERKKEIMDLISEERLDVAIDVPEDVLTSGTADYISKEVFNENTIDDIHNALNSVVVSGRFAAEGIDYDRVNELTQRIRLKENKVTRSGVIKEEKVVGEMMLVIVFVMILYMTLLTWGMVVQRSIIEEKSSRVIEVILSSLEPKDLFIGKIVGIGALGLTQILVWSVMMLAIPFSSALVVAQVANFVNISVMDLVFFALFFVLGFLLYSAMFMAIGAVCSTEQDAQNLQTITILPLIVPLMVMMLIIQNPNTTVSVILSLIPLFSPMLMLARIVIAEPSPWEIALSIMILLISIYGAISFSARVFRVGILMYGKRPSLREIIKWARYA